MVDITVYTDGAARGNPGNGGYGVIMISGKYRKEISQGFAHTTNNRMELLAAIVALEHIKAENANVTIYSDSRYVVDAINQNWLKSWESKHFKNRKNLDLWMRFLKVYRRYNVKFVWVAGHAGNPLNELCDKLAVAASMQSNLQEDEGYIQSIEDNALL
ncbi:MAG: ribonuclease HI [Prevotellaceae bacterium]|jgi:ribonuclease HI|nr:ribonuclease HI [Prevotellaceae bacterium]